MQNPVGVDDFTPTGFRIHSRGLRRLSLERKLDFLFVVQRIIYKAYSAS